MAEDKETSRQFNQMPARRDWPTWQLNVGRGRRTPPQTLDPTARFAPHEACLTAGGAPLWE